MSSTTDLEAGQGSQAAPPAVLTDHEEGDSALSPREAQPVVSQAESRIQSGVFRPFTSMGGGSNIDYSQRNAIDQSTQPGQGSSKAEAQIRPPSEQEPEESPEEPRMIGDFDGSSKALWKLFRDEAKSLDSARIVTLKDDMGNALVFAGLFSAALTAFVVDSKQNLNPSAADQTVYYLQQHSTILSQISVQLSSIAPQVSIPSTPPPPFPVFNPSATDVRVNVFWFTALAFGLLAASLAILVQNWARNYMRLFQRYSDPLKSSRLRQYLNEGRERWKMPAMAEAVPGLLNVSLLLFFVGLADSLFNINTKVAISTIVPIGISALLYIFMVFSPIVYPQSPYQNLFSGVLWYLFQKSHGRKFRDHGSDGEMKTVSANMAQGRMELAMEETEARKDRDVRAIQWLIDNLTEDTEMEKFLSAIPGSFNTDWGTEVWKTVGKPPRDEDQGQDQPVARPHAAHHPSSSWSIHSALRPITQLVRKPAPRRPHTHEMTRSLVSRSAVHIQGDNIMHKLSTHVARSVGICKNVNFFANNVDLWRTRTRTCIEATASLVCCVNTKLAWFGGISKLLGDIGSFEKIRELSLAGRDELFVIHWTCLSLVAIRPILAANRDVQHYARRAMGLFAEADDTRDNDGLAAAQKMDKTVQRANDYLFRLYDALRNTEDLTEEVTEILRGHESEITELERINIEADYFEPVDHGIFDMQNAINENSHQILSQFPGVLYDSDLALIPFSRFVELSCDPHKPQFIHPRHTLKSMCSPAPTLRSILEAQGDADAFKELLKNLKRFRFSSDLQGDHAMERQLWRLQDLRDGAGLGCTVELFFLALSQRLSTLPSEYPSALYTGTFRAITSDWSKHKHSLGTQKLLLDIAMSRREEFAVNYPADIIDEFLLLLSNVIEGQTGAHIDKSMQQFESLQLYDSGRFRERVLRVLRQAQSS